MPQIQDRERQTRCELPLLVASSLSHSHAFVGRTAELEVLGEELAAMKEGSPRAVLIEGPVGIGKSAMIDHLLADKPDLTVLRATGEQWEAHVAFGVVDQLMRST